MGQVPRAVGRAAPGKRQPDAVAGARAMIDAGQHDSAIEVLECIPPGERNYDAHHLLGVAYLRSGKKPASARHSFRAALELKPESAMDHCYLGDTYLAEDKGALAIKSYEMAERLGLHSPELAFNMAEAYCNLGAYLGRLESRALPDGVAGRLHDTVYVLEPMAGQPGRYLVATRASAIFHLQRALDAGLDTPEAQLLHADIWLRARRFARSLEIYKQLEGKVPQPYRERYHRNFADACLARDDVDGYLAQTKRALALTPGPHEQAMADAYLRVAARFNAAGDLDAYVRYLRLAVAADPESADLHYRLGNAFDDAGRLKDASRHWRIALELQPDHPDRQRMLERVRQITAGQQDGIAAP